MNQTDQKSTHSYLTASAPSHSSVSPPPPPSHFPRGQLISSYQRTATERKIAGRTNINYAVDDNDINPELLHRYRHHRPQRPGKVQKPAAHPSTRIDLRNPPSNYIRPQTFLPTRTLNREEQQEEAEVDEDGNDLYRINRRRRTLAAELLILEHNFNHVEQKPDLLLRMQLARELDMSPREVQVWFQNRRAKTKKLMEKFVNTSTPVFRRGPFPYSSSSSSGSNQYQGSPRDRHTYDAGGYQNQDSFYSSSNHFSPYPTSGRNNYGYQGDYNSSEVEGYRNSSGSSHWYTGEVDEERTQSSSAVRDQAYALPATHSPPQAPSPTQQNPHPQSVQADL